jgi:hypothetical protein
MIQTYCPQLGMVVEIPYCLSCNGRLPCRNFVRCFGGRIDIGKILSAFDAEDLKKVFGEVPKSRLERIAEILTSLGKG